MSRSQAVLTIEAPSEKVFGELPISAILEQVRASLAEYPGVDVQLSWDESDDDDVSDDDLVTAVLEALEAALDDDDPRPSNAVFTTSEWDNGYFFDTSPTVTFTDGTKEQVEVDDVRDVLTDYGSRYSLGSSAELRVDLAFSTVEFDEYGFRENST